MGRKFFGDATAGSCLEHNANDSVRHSNPGGQDDALSPAHPSRPRRWPCGFPRLIKLVDKDGDGTISLAEAQAFAAQRFDRLDTEHKGYLTLESYEAPPRRATDRASEARRPALERALPRAEAAFKALNKAGDGRLTKDEFLADSRARFAAADIDKDGKLTIDELRHTRGHAF
jgi:Ca2+-binding EF-hand superfamily protein